MGYIVSIEDSNQTLEQVVGHAKEILHRDNQNRSVLCIYKCVGKVKRSVITNFEEVKE